MTVWPNRVLPFRQDCPRCGALRGSMCVATSDEDALDLSGWKHVPHTQEFLGGMAHVERFLPVEGVPMEGKSE